MATPKALSGDTLRFTATGAVTAGVPVEVDNFFALPAIDGVSGDKINADLVGVWELDKSTDAAAGVFAEGAACYWDGSAVTNVAAGNRFIGHCFNVGGRVAADTKIRVRIDARAHAPGATSGKARLVLDASSGLAIGSYYGDSIPDNARVTRSYYEVETTATSATDAATIALGIETDDVGGITAAIAISDGTNPWDAGVFDGIQDGALANFSEKTTGERRLQADVAVEALTDGVIALVAEWAVLA